MSKKEITNLSDRIVEAINNTTNDYDAKEEVIKIADNMCRDLLANTVIENYHIEALDDSLD